MRISGTEPSSVILSQTLSIKSLKAMTKKYQKQAEAKRDLKNLFVECSFDLNVFFLYRF